MASVSGLAVASLQLLNERYRPYKGTCLTFVRCMHIELVDSFIEPRCGCGVWYRNDQHAIVSMTGVRTITKSGRFQVRSG